MTSPDISEMTLPEKIEHIKNTINCQDVLDMLEIDAPRGKIHSPFNEGDMTPSCHVYSDHFHCYSTGKGGDVIDLAMVLTGKTWGQTVHLLAKGAERMEADPNRVRRSVAAEPIDMTEQFLEYVYLNVEDLAQTWKARLAGVRKEQLEMYFRGWILGAIEEPDQLLIPHWHEGKVHGVKVRAKDGTKTAWPGSQFATGLYWTVERQNEHCVIVEGESDCWALEFMMSDVDVFALPSGAGTWRDAWLDELEDYKFIHTAFDNDRAGKEATQRVRTAIGYGRWKELRVPGLYNDCREAIKAGWEPKLP